MSTIERLKKGFTDKIIIKEVGAGKFSIVLPMYKMDKTTYEVFLVPQGNGFILSDEGSTMEELKKIFFIEEPEVVKNLALISKQYGVKRNENTIYVECTPNDIHIKLSHLILALSFMVNMKIFYV